MENVKVLILAAGKGTRMHKAFPDVLKPLAPIGAEPLLLRTLRQLNEVGLDDVTVVTGYRADELKAAALSCFPNTKFVKNPLYEEDRNIYSLLCGLAHTKGQAVLVIEGDVVFSDSAIVELVFQLKDISFWCVCGKFSSGQIGGIIDANEAGNIRKISYVNEYTQEFSDYWKNLGVLYIAAAQIESYKKLLHRYAEKTLDQYFLTPWAEHLDKLPAKIVNLGRSGAASFNTRDEYDAAMARLGLIKNGNKFPWVMVDVETLKHIEEFDPSRVDWLANKIYAERVWTVPLVVDDKHGLVMDGQHRLEVALRLGFQKVPAVTLPYDTVRVYSLRPGTHSVSVEEIVERALKGNIYPYKTAKHHFNAEIEPCSVPISELY